MLNGAELKLTSDGNLPGIAGAPEHAGQVSLDAASITFFRHSRGRELRLPLSAGMNLVRTSNDVGALTANCFPLHWKHGSRSSPHSP